MNDSLLNSHYDEISATPPTSDDGSELEIPQADRSESPQASSRKKHCNVTEEDLDVIIDADIYFPVSTTIRPLSDDHCEDPTASSKAGDQVDSENLVREEHEDSAQTSPGQKKGHQIGPDDLDTDFTGIESLTIGEAAGVEQMLSRVPLIQLSKLRKLKLKLRRTAGDEQARRLACLLSDLFGPSSIWNTLR